MTAAAAVAAQSGTGPTGLWVFLVVLGGWMVTLCLHEFAHAVVALACGDTSVRARGYLTLNPLRYTNATYSFVIPLILLAVGGIPLPGGAVLVEPHRFRKVWYATLVSLAGPLTNALAGVVLAAASAGLASPLGAALQFLALLQFVTAVLNLLPVPGFDGFGALEPYLAPATKARIAPIRPWAPLLLFVVLFSVPQVSGVLFDAGAWLLSAAGGSQYLAAVGQSLFRFWA
ncbi:Zn-dependent protease [Nakamurella flavida]|uniref:site-2 protease family protein n=1 Tax=Nakamurella flavida TaxID=363630 RepID=UPI0027884DB2|nr:site-2 protease family protein [Nakamurella flavida]MDP9777648.1 Zn-dependent protease [Nakamurella flavida]